MQRCITIFNFPLHFELIVFLSASQQSSTARPLGVRHQVGLKAVRVSHRHAGWVNVHDPVASKFHRLREDEYFLLCQLDGQCSLNDLQEQYQSQYPNRRVTPVQINALLFRFHESGLTLSHSPGQGTPLLLKADKERRKKWFALSSQWLFIRLPGVDPKPVMRWISPMVRPLLSLPGVLLGAMLVASACVVMLVNQDQFVRELPAASQWLTMQNALILACVVGLTKIAHELGHAAVSERFGARCRSIGPMLLVFTPALYCDTSESWMLASRWKRAAVALAGIATEVVIASIAAWVWVASPPGLVHTTASHVIIVCGISTVFFNANPLLRYDGYYLLSDLTDVPNLGQRANRRLTSLLSWGCFGIRNDAPHSEPADRSWWLLFYAVASVVYRWVLMFSIILFIWIALRPHGLEIVGQIAAVLALTNMIVAGAIPLTRFLKNPTNRRKIVVPRLVLSVVAVVLLSAFGFVPYRWQAIVSGRIVPASETRVFVASSGRLERVQVQPGQRVRQGDVLAVLSNPGYELQRIDAESRLDQQLIRIETLRQSQSLVPEAAQHLAASEEMLDELRSEVASVRRKQDALTIKSPCDGVVVAAMGNRHRGGSGQLDADGGAIDPDADRLPTDVRADVRLASWSGHPTDPQNLGCVLESGTELLAVADTSRWVAEVAVDSKSASRVELGSVAKVIWDARPKVVWSGTVTEVSDERFDPRLDAQRRDHPEGSQGRWTPQTRHLVRVAIDGQADGSETESDVAGATEQLAKRQPDWRVGSTAQVKLVTPARSFWQRVAEGVAGLTRFR